MRSWAPLYGILIDFLIDFLMDFTSSGSSELGGDLQKNVFFFLRVLGVPSWAETSTKIVFYYYYYYYYYYMFGVLYKVL